MTSASGASLHRLWASLSQASDRFYRGYHQPTSSTSNRTNPLPTIWNGSDSKTLVFYETPEHDENQLILQAVAQDSWEFQQPNSRQTSTGVTLTPMASPPQDVKHSCAFCLETVEEVPTATWTKLPCCHQELHLECVKKALAQDRRCGLCRNVIL